MIYLNGHALCAIDVETTGLVAGYHEITQVCFLPLDATLEVRQDIIPFDLLLHIEHEDRIDPDAMKLTRTKFYEHQQKAIDKYQAADLLVEWVERFNLPFRKRIMPLAHNWKFDAAFILEWLGPTSFEQFIDGRSRDTMCCALYANDIAAMRHEQVPFPKVNLPYVASQLKIPHDRAHEALADCVTTVEVYKKMMNHRMLQGLS